MTERITPRVDIAFKKIFGVEENKDLLISLINSIVSEGDRVVGVDILNPYNPRNFRNDKLSILDIKARCHTGNLYNIEIQISDEGDYDKRALLYWAKLYAEQLKKSEDYSTLNKTIGIHILNFTSIPEVNKYHNVFQLMEKESKVHHFKDMELHTIELNKFETSMEVDKETKNRSIILDKTEELKLMLPKIKTSLDRWSTFLTRYDLLETNKLPKELNNPELQKALDVLEVMNFTKQEREAYEDHLKWLRVEANTLKKAEGKAFNKGKAEGESKRNIEIAKKMLAKKKPVEEIAEFTGLTKEEINSLGS
jgi:predicted transposase/invertase (TIGR01784 family)